MKTQLAWLNLLHQKTRTIVAVAGVSFAVVLVLLQLGFLSAVRTTATLVYDQLDFDILLASRQYLYLAKSGTIKRVRLVQANAVPGVVGTGALDIGFQLWRNADTGQRRGIMIYAIDPSGHVFKHEEIRDQQDRLETPNTVLIDSMTRKEFGPLTAGVVTEVGRHRVEIAGVYTLGNGFGADGDMLTSDDTFRRLLPYRLPTETSLGLVRIAPGADPNAVAAELRRILPQDVQVITRAELNAHERHHWIVKTSVGVIFGFGVFVAVLVGTAIVYQVLSSDIATHLPEYATLKAMGYPRRYLSRLVLQQAWILSVAGFVPGLLLAGLLYKITERAAHIPIEMTAGRAVTVLALSVVMCSISGLASLAKVHSADPADLF